MRDKIYNAIVSYIEQNGYPPSYRELMNIVGLKSTSSVHAHIMKLVDEEKIEIGINGEPRTIRVKGLRIMKDSFCEWKFDANGIVWHCNGCESYNLPYAMNLRIIADDFDCRCPHCGKRIKAVE